jgi:hypothetical protein
MNVVSFPGRILLLQLCKKAIVIFVWCIKLIGNGSVCLNWVINQLRVMCSSAGYMTTVTQKSLQWKENIWKFHSVHVADIHGYFCIFRKKNWNVKCWYYLVHRPIPSVKMWRLKMNSSTKHLPAGVFVAWKVKQDVICVFHYSGIGL